MGVFKFIGGEGNRRGGGRRKAWKKEKGKGETQTNEKRDKKEKKN